MTTRVLVERGYMVELDGMYSPAGADGCAPWAELAASTAQGCHGRRSEQGADGVGQALTQALTAPSPGGGEAALRMEPSLGTALARYPLQCLRCQLLGRRRLTCARREVCLEVPRAHPLGAILLLAWVGTAAAFVVSLW